MADILDSFHLYAQMASTFAPPTPLTGDGYLLGALGLTGEAGEVADLVKKHLYHGHELDADKLLRELGDVLWYVAFMAGQVGSTLEEVANLNIEKLRKRYPEGFSEAASIARVDVNPVPA